MYDFMIWDVRGVYLLFAIKIIFILMLFSCLLVMLVRQRVMIQILKEIRDKK